MATVPNAVPQDPSRRYSNVAVDLPLGHGRPGPVPGLARLQLRRHGPGARARRSCSPGTRRRRADPAARARPADLSPDQPAAALSAELPRWERVAGTWNHRLFYLLLIAMPIVGVHRRVGTLPRARRSRCSAASRSRRFRASRRHSARSPATSMSAAAWLLDRAIVLHVAAALKHQFFDRNRAVGPDAAVPRSGRRAGGHRAGRRSLGKQAEHRERHAPRRRRWSAKVADAAVAVPQPAGAEAGEQRRRSR